MRKQQRRLIDKITATGMPRLALPGAIAAIVAGLSMSTCSDVATTIDPCNTVDDCPYTPHLSCRDSMCTCDEGYIPCDYKCLLPSECSPGAGGGGGHGGTGGDSGSGGGAGGGAGGSCKTVDDCAKPGDPHCGTATCKDGVCGLELKPFGKLASQLAGDCKDLWCDGAGNLIEILEASDTYNDGAQCTMDTCQAGQAKNQPYPNANTCPETSEGYCYDGACVACVANMTFCAPGFACDGVVCVPMHCVNNQWDQGLGETAQNCGGPCRPCSPGDTCKVPKDCFDGVCISGICQPPTCTDGARNDNETGVDCGGPTGCPLCPAGEGCKAAADCLSKVCWAGKCQPPKCDDGIQNGDETDWDCGGACAPCP
jgi:hypothetical protein